LVHGSHINKTGAKQMTFTHIFINHVQTLVPLADATDAVNTAEAHAFGFSLVDINKVKFDKHGNPCRSSGGWSYGHVQGGHICAGAGGVNSLPVMPL
jgi:hypothetical protein